MSRLEKDDIAVWGTGEGLLYNKAKNSFANAYFLSRPSAGPPHPYSIPSPSHMPAICLAYARHMPGICLAYAGHMTGI